MLDCVKYLEDNSTSTTTMLKLIRLIRLKRIFSLFDASRVNTLADALFSNTNKSKKVVYTLIVKNFYNVIRLILLTIIITYFTGAIYYLFSDLMSKSFLINLQESLLELFFHMKIK